MNSTKIIEEILSGEPISIPYYWQKHPIPNKNFIVKFISILSAEQGEYEIHPYINAITFNLLLEHNIIEKAYVSWLPDSCYLFVKPHRFVTNEGYANPLHERSVIYPILRNNTRYYRLVAPRRARMK